MKFLFWFGLSAEAAALFWNLYKAWIVFSGRSTYVESYHVELYRQALIPATLMALIVASALIARFYFKAPRIATYIVLSPVAVMVLAGVGMIVASMFIKDWR